MENSAKFRSEEIGACADNLSDLVDAVKTQLTDASGGKEVHVEVGLRSEVNNSQ